MASQGLRSRLDMSLPAGAPLTDEVYARRHAAMRYLLAAHIPFLVVFGITQSVGVPQTVLETAPALLALLLSTYLTTTRARAVLSSLGLVSCSFAAIHMSNGSIEAQLHMFVILAFVSLYQDWAPFIATIVGDLVIYLATAAADKNVLFRNDKTALDAPFLWAAIGCLAIGALGVALLQVWAQAEERAVAATDLATRLDRADSEAMLERVGATVADFHAAGAYHADLNAHNVLIGRERIWLIDFDRGELRVPRAGWRHANLARLQRSIHKVLGDGARAARLDAALIAGYEARWSALSPQESRA